MSAETNKIVRLGIDLAKGATGTFSTDEAEHTLRQSLVALTGGEKFDARAFRRNKVAIFEVMEDILDVLITEGIENQFADFVDYRNVNHGDKPVFMVDDYKLFPVATIAAGNNNIRRQTLDRSPFNVSTAYKGVKFYEDLELFLAGRVDWNKLITKVQKSFNAQIAADIYNAIVAGYSALTAPYTYTGVWDLTQFNTLVTHVEAATDRQAFVAGTKLALQKATPAYVAYNGQAVVDRNNDGFFRVVDGVTMMEIKQAHTPGTDNFAIANNFLLALPAGEEKIVKLVLEGEPEIKEVTNNANEDDTMEYLFKKKYGVAAITSSKYGVYILS
jgi:hypothetical protein